MGHLQVLKDSIILILRLLNGKLSTVSLNAALSFKKELNFYPSRWRGNLQWEYEFSVWPIACMRWYVFCLRLGSNPPSYIHIISSLDVFTLSSFIYLFSLYIMIKQPSFILLILVFSSHYSVSNCTWLNLLLYHNIPTISDTCCQNTAALTFNSCNSSLPF